MVPRVGKVKEETSLQKTEGPAILTRGKDIRRGTWGSRKGEIGEEGGGRRY